MTRQIWALFFAGLLMMTFVMATDNSTAMSSPNSTLTGEDSSSTTVLSNTTPSPGGHAADSHKGDKKNNGVQGLNAAFSTILVAFFVRSLV